jgi:hypothetical protein
MSLFTILTFLGTSAADVALVEAYLDRYSVFRYSPEGRVKRGLGPAHHSLKIDAEESVLYEIAQLGIGFAPYALKKNLAIDVFLHYIQPTPYSLRMVKIEPTLVLSTILAPGETLGHPITSRLVDYYTVLRIRVGDREDQETFFGEKLRDLLDAELVRLVFYPPTLTIEAAKEAFDDVLAAGRDYYRLGLEESPVVCVVDLQTSDMIEHPLTFNVTVGSLLASGFSVGHFLRSHKLPVASGAAPPPKKVATKQQSIFPVWTTAEAKMARRLENREKDHTRPSVPPLAPVPPRQPTEAERAKVTVTRKAPTGARPWMEAAVEWPPPDKKEKEFDAIFEESVKKPRVPPSPTSTSSLVSKSEGKDPKSWAASTDEEKEKYHIPTNADEAFGEKEMQAMHQDALCDILGWKPWIEADDVEFLGKCHCKYTLATMVAQPCEHLCLCKPCYATYLANPALSERCPRCSAPVTTYEELYAPDDFMHIDAPPQRAYLDDLDLDDDDEKWDKDMESDTD